MTARLLVILFCLFSEPALAQCRHALALGLDVSASVDSGEYRLQVEGLAAALRDPEVSQLMLANGSTSMRLAIFEWTEPGHERMLLNWTEIQTAADLNAISQRLIQTSRKATAQGTAVGAAMVFGVDLLNQQRTCWRRTLDLSGDGKHNLGPHPRDVRTALRDSGVTINGLVIGADDPSSGDRRYVQVGELSAYYNTWVISGPNAFVEVALGFEAYAEAMTRKLIRELDSLVLSEASPDQ
ncbi:MULTISPECIES: DUF1194 domain-containing protein [unclassified Ruegeria]|uniref:DUF1194 domain-containing protein n=1 Tax=unclassified Ruegeria TaxID=2625375 RepID=UPI001488E32D|nr:MULTISPECIES: DUF1194 domain-containing protein [unclassified Ruegeria]NOD47077.1 DUF1194 domain-containing protein [Ruegeria sp. HKCCD5849]NOD51400.1 DUF1194 domain-containing protein [Ruegeria sp. HKCCD5851]NOD68219.1 DUF1194 domain-containing protein [Ruegeria sp. HKCCD7303]NOE33297.1 DUF1194 domain-containing protein [Ruegeria sp. HKCCD7318]